MKHFTPSSGTRTPHSRSRVRLIVPVLMALGCLAACGKKEPARPAQEALAPKSAAVSDSKIESMALEALAPAESRKSPKAELQAGLESRAEDILARYPEKNAAELLNVPEVNEALKVGLTRLSKDKRMQDQINNGAAMVAKMQGFSGEPGTVGLDLDIKGYDHARKSRMLQAVLSEDPKQIVRFVTEEVGEAAPELTYGGVQRASNGVAIKETPPPTK
jgi:predicted small lipoprotein YifL